MTTDSSEKSLMSTVTMVAMATGERQSDDLMIKVLLELIASILKCDYIMSANERFLLLYY